MAFLGVDPLLEDTIASLTQQSSGAISVTAADCPDRVCLSQGRISQSGMPIACVPHRLVIQIEGGKLDG